MKFLYVTLTMTYGYKKQVALSFAAAVERVRAALITEGFGVITEIDAQATFQKKLGVEFSPYLILGACHPASAHVVLQADKELGLLLPCNVIIYEDAGTVTVSAILPATLISAVGKPELTALADEIEAKLKRAVDRV